MDTVKIIDTMSTIGTMDTIDIKESSDYYHKDLDMTINDKVKNIELIKDNIDYTSPMLYYHGNRTNFTSINSILNFISMYYPYNLIINSQNEIMIKYNDSKFLVVEFHTYSVESDDNIIGLKAWSTYPYNTKVYQILNPEHDGLKRIRTSFSHTNYNEFFPYIAKAIVELISLHPSEIMYMDNIKLATDNVYQVYEQTYGTILERVDLFADRYIIPSSQQIKNRLERLKSRLIESNAEYIMGHPNPFCSSAHKVVVFNRMCVSVLSFMIDRI